MRIRNVIKIEAGIYLFVLQVFLGDFIRLFMFLDIKLSTIPHRVASLPIYYHLINSSLWVSVVVGWGNDTGGSLVLLK